MHGALYDMRGYGAERPSRVAVILLFGARNYRRKERIEQGFANRSVTDHRKLYCPIAIFLEFCGNRNGSKALPLHRWVGKRLRVMSSWGIHSVATSWHRPPRSEDFA